MESPEFYLARQQTFIKHHFLENYLEKVVYTILSFQDEFVFIDGFSGPWKSKDENLGDTSFAIAIKLFRKISDGFQGNGKTKIFRCLFNEVDDRAFTELDRFCEHVHDIQIETHNSRFEDLIPEITRFIGKSFSLTFIDPTGLTGFPMKTLEPLLKMRGEVIINFMYDHFNRFMNNPEASASFKSADLFGGEEWLHQIDHLRKCGHSREEAILAIYTESLGKAGNNAFTTSTPIPYTLKDRTFFHLVYGTRHRKGILEFRELSGRPMRNN